MINIFGFAFFAVLIILFALILTGVWIWALIDCIISDKPFGEKLIWLIVIFLFNIIGALLYFLLKNMLNSGRENDGDVDLNSRKSIGSESNGAKSVGSESNGAKSVGSESNGAKSVGAKSAGNEKRLKRSSDDRVIAGVCGGMGEYFSTDPTLIRLLWVAFTLLSAGTGILIYLIAAIIIPSDVKPSVGRGDSNRLMMFLLALIVVSIIVFIGIAMIVFVGMSSYTHSVDTTHVIRDVQVITEDHIRNIATEKIISPVYETMPEAAVEHSGAEYIALDPMMHENRIIEEIAINEGSVNGSW